MTEKFTTYKIIPNNNFYLASSDGDIFSLKSNKFLKQGFTKRGYREVKLSNNGIAKTKLVHRLIASAFFGGSNLSVDHINFNKKDNRINNLRYLSTIDNYKVAIDNGMIKSGSNHYKSSFSKEDIIKIRNLELSNSEIANLFNSTPNIIYKIRTKRTYKNG